MSVSPIGSKLRLFILDYRDLTAEAGAYLPGYLSSNHIEIDRLKTCFLVAFRTIYIPDDLRCELLWPSHTSLPSLEDTTDGEPSANETVPSLVTPLPVHFPNYIHDPRHMLCLSCLSDVLRSKFWFWWEVHRKLPPVNAPDRPDCWYGIHCRTQSRADHATTFNVSSLFDELCSPTVLMDFCQHWCPTTREM